MNFTALDIIHFWSDSRGKTIQKVIPSNEKVYVFCTDDLSSEAAKVCHFLNLIFEHPWTFQKKCENDLFVITFFPERISLDNLFQMEKQTQAIKKPLRKERKRRGRQ